MDLDNVDDTLLLGDGFEPNVPSSLVTSASVMDISFHPKLPILAAGLVTGEVEIYEYHGCEVTKKPLENDFSSWIFGQKTGYNEDEVVMNYHHSNMLMHPTGAASAMEFTDDGSYLVSVSSDKSISVLDCVSARLVIHIAPDQMNSVTTAKKKRINPMNAKSTTPSGVVKKDKKSVRVSKKGLVVPVNPHKHGISALNVCDQNLIATGDDDGLIAVWDMRERRPVHFYHEHGDFVSQLCYFTDVQELVSSSGDTCLGVYDMRGARIRDYSEKRKEELSCFAFINSSGANNSSFIPSIICGTPNGTLPLWKYGSWRRPYDLMDWHPKECESIISFHGEDTSFNHNIILTGACDGLVRVIQMYPLRRNLCQLSARDYSYSHSSANGPGASSSHQHNSNFIVKKKRGQEGITRMRVSHDNGVLAVCGADNIIDFVDVRFLNDEKELDKVRGRAEQRHMNTLRVMEKEAADADERERELQRRLAAGENSDSDDGDDGSDSDSSSMSDSDSDSDSEGDLMAQFARREAAKKLNKAQAQRHKKDSNEHNASEDSEKRSPQRKMRKGEAQKGGSAVSTAARAVQLTQKDTAKANASSSAASRSGTAKPEKALTEKQEEDKPVDYMEELMLNRAQKRDRAAAVRWMKEEKRKKINFTFEKRRRRVGGFFGDMVNNE